MQLCEEEFENDYGMCIKWLLDFRRGLLSSPNEELSARIDINAEEIKKINAKISKDGIDDKSIKMVSGKKLNRGE